MMVRLFDLSIQLESANHLLNDPNYKLLSMKFSVSKEDAVAKVEMKIQPCEPRVIKRKRLIAFFFTSTFNDDDRIHAIINNKRNRIRNIETTHYNEGSMFIIDYEQEKGG